MRLIALVLLALVSLSACTGTPDNVEPVKNFELKRYLGTWYEVARLPHPFEEGLSRVTAEYALRDDGGVSVINRGFNADNQEWEEAEGKAYFVGAENVGHLKVSFFGPFYASYVVAELDPQYRYAMVTGPDRDYLWILSRQPELPESTLQRLVSKAKAMNYDVSKLQYIDHK